MLKNARGSIHFLLLFLLVVSLVTGFILLKGNTRFFTRASTDNIYFFDSSGNAITTATTADVNVKMIEPSWSALSAASTLGPNSPQSVSSSAITGSASNWTNIDLIKTSDNRYTSANIKGQNFSNYLQITNFGFSIPSNASVTGISFQVEKKSKNGSNITDNKIQIIKSGNIGSTNKALLASWGTSDTYINYGGSNDLWSESWTPADINNANFGIAISTKGTKGNDIAYIDHVRATIYYTTPILVTTKSVVLAEDSNFTVNPKILAFTTSVIPYTFSNSNSGIKQLYVKFIASDAREQNAVPFPATIEMLAPTPIPTPLPTSTPTPLQPVQVLMPNGGEGYNVGDTMTIKWQINDITQYNQTGSSIWLANRSTQVDGSYVYQNQIPILEDPKTLVMQAGENTLNWVIPSSWTYTSSVTGEQITFVVGGGSYVILVGIDRFAPNYDHSDGTFTILNPTSSPAPTPTLGGCSNSTGTVQVLQPNGGESYHIGNSMTIKWCVNDFSQYSQNYSGIWLATRSTQSNGTYVYRNQVLIADNAYMQVGENNLSWDIPSTLSVGYNYVIAVDINAFNPNYDYSDQTFAILSP